MLTDYEKMLAEQRAIRRARNAEKRLDPAYAEAERARWAERSRARRTDPLFLAWQLAYHGAKRRKLRAGGNKAESLKAGRIAGARAAAKARRELAKGDAE